MLVDTLFFKSVESLLDTFTHHNPPLKSYCIRHSNSIKPQNPLLSDLDLTFFVKCANFQEYREVRKQILSRFSEHRLLQKAARNPLVLPNTTKALSLCEKYYPFRSVYPMQTWRAPKKEPQAKPISISRLLPLDHAPENALYYSLLPAFYSNTPRFLEPWFLERKVKKDSLLVGVPPPKRRNTKCAEAILSEIEIWNEYYASLKFTPLFSDILFENDGQYGFEPYQHHWDALAKELNVDEVIESAWLYPNWFNHAEPNLTINIRPQIEAKEFGSVLNQLKEKFKGLEYTLWIGSETAMLGRLGGMSRLNLLDSWFFKHHGLCLHGNSKVSDKLALPTVEMLKIKFYEFFLYFTTETVHHQRFRYEFYKLLFIFENLLNTNTLLLNEDSLLGLFPGKMQSRKDFISSRVVDSMILILDKTHGFTFF